MPNTNSIKVGTSEGIHIVRAKVFEMVLSGVVDDRVTKQIISTDAKFDEPGIWDFKQTLPCWPAGKSLSDDASFKLDEIVKDNVSFYNSYGGYIIAGLEDKTRKVCGFNDLFNVEDLNRRIYVATGVNVECVFRDISHSEDGSVLPIGLLHIPRRPASQLPATFKTDSMKTSTGRTAFRRGEFYLRQRDECRPARTPEDFAFLYSDSNRKIVTDLPEAPLMLENNLPDRDGELGAFIGRDQDVANLWRWLSDAFSPLKLISGLGGVGKTTLAYHFAELFIYTRPEQFDKLVWLGAKQKTWLPTKGEFGIPSRVDFFSVEQFLQKLAIELGCPATIAEASVEREDLIGLVIENLSEFRFLVVIDDVDTLEDEQQQVMSHTIQLIFSRSSSKALMTARRNLGLPRGHFVELEGIPRSEFYKFVASKCDLLGIPCPLTDCSAELLQLFEASNGSPLFVVSILRLVELGTPLKEALKQWRGAAGGRVRDAAFSREVGRLRMVEARTLLAAIYLRETSSIELKAVLRTSEFEIQQAVDQLRNFSMITVASDLPGGAAIVVPRTLAMMTSVVEARLPDNQSLRLMCEEQRRLNNNPVPFVREAIRRCMALLQSSDPQSATETAKSALESLPQNPDLLCMLGRCKLSTGPEYGAEAVECFREAEALGGRRRELFDLWISALKTVGDLDGIVTVSQLAEERLRVPGRYVTHRTLAAIERSDNYMRANRYADAARTCLERIAELKRLLNFNLSSDINSEVRRCQHVLIRKWLNSVSADCATPSEASRLIGAVLKGVIEYGWLDPQVGARAFDLLSRFLAEVSTRKTISEGLRNKVGQDVNRLREIRTFVEGRLSNDRLTRKLDDLISSCLDLLGRP